MKLATAALPTRSAMSIAKSVGMLPAERGFKSDDVAAYDEMYEHLIEFQQMCLACEFEDALIAYHGHEIDDRARKGLKLIYKTTQHWILGHVIGELLEFLNSDISSGKESIAAATLILENLIDDGVVSKEQAASLIINLANTGQVGSTEALKDAS